MSTNFAELLLVADTSGLKAAKRDLADITKAGAATEAGVKKAMKGVEGAVNTVTPATRGAAAAMLDLRKSLDPVYAASKQYEAAQKQVTAAVKLGAASQAEANQILALAEKRYLGVGAAANTSNTALGAASKGMNSFAFQSRMAAMQLSQVAQQTMAGGGFIRALSIQLPDLALGFGAVGIAAGVAAGVILPLAANFLTGAGNADSLSDAIDDLTAASQHYISINDETKRSVADLSTEFGGFADVMQRNLELMEGIALSQALDSLNEAIREVDVSGLAKMVTIFANGKGEIEALNDNYNQALADIYEGFKLTGDQAVVFLTQLDNLQSAKGPAEVAVAADSLNKFLIEAYGSARDIPPELREMVQNLGDAQAVAARVASRLDGSADAAQNAANSAGGIANQLSGAVNQAIALRNALVSADAAIGAIGLDVTRKIATIKARNVALQNGQNEAIAGEVALLKQKLGEQTKALINGGASLDQAVEQTKAVRDQVEEYTGLLTQNDALQKSLKKTSTAGSSAGGGISKAMKQAERDTRAATREAAKLAEEYADAINAPIASAIDGTVDYMLSGFKGGFKGLWDIAKQTFLDIAKFYLANPIKLSFCVGGVALPAAAGASPIAGQPAGGGGILGGVFSKALGGFGNAGSILGLGGLGGGSGLLGGLGNAISGGIGNIFSIGANAAAAGGGFLASVGAAIPVLGIAAAAFIFFKKKVELLDGGLRITTEGMDSLIDSFKTEKITRFFGLSKKVKTSFDALDAETAGPLTKIIGEIQSGVVGTASALGIASSAFDTFSSEITVSTKDMTDEQAQAAVTEALQGFGDDFAGMVPGLAALQREGEGAYVALQRLVGDLNAMNEATYLMRDSVADMSLASAAAASDLITLSGGLEAFSTKTQFVFENMLTDAAQEMRLTEIATEKLNGTLGALGIAIPDTHAEFMAMLDGQDLMTEAGRNTHAALLDVAGAFVQVNGTAQAAADAVAAQAQAAIDAAEQAAQAQERAKQDQIDSANAALSSAQSALAAAFGAEADRIRAAYELQIDAAIASADAANVVARAQADESDRLRQARIDGLSDQADVLSDRVSIYRTIADALADAYTDRRVLTALGQRTQLSSAQAFLRGAVASGGTTDVDRLEAALDTVADPSAALFKSFADYQQDFNVNTNLIETLGKIQGDTLTIEERALRAVEDQIDVLRDVSSAEIDSIQANTSAIEAARDAELAALESQMNALLGIDTSVMSVSAAIRSLAAAQGAVDAATGGTGAAGSANSGGDSSGIGNVLNNSGSYGLSAAEASAINAAYNGAFGYTPDGALTTWGRAINRDGKSLDEAVSQIYGFAGMSVPSYANGTDYHPGGMAQLHQNELVNLPRGTSVSTAGEVREMVSELKALRQSNTEMAAELRQIRRFAQSRTDIVEDQRAEELAAGSA